MTTFRDKDSGAEWEEDESWQDHIAQTYKVIRPVKIGPKWEIKLHDHVHRFFDLSIDVSFNGSKDQAQLIKEAVEALMEYINYESSGHLYRKESMSLKAADKARQAMKGDK